MTAASIGTDTTGIYADWGQIVAPKDEYGARFGQGCCCLGSVIVLVGCTHRLLVLEAHMPAIELMPRLSASDI